jgi:hypothetical protein
MTTAILDFRLAAPSRTVVVDLVRRPSIGTNSG